MTDTPPETGHWWKRHWVTVVIIAVLIYLTAAIWGIGAYYADNRQQADSAADQYRAYAERTVSCDGIDALAERYACLAEVVQAEQQRLYAAANLRTQQDMSSWNFATVWISLGLLVVTGVGVTYVALTLDEAKAATRAAVKAAEAAENTVLETRRIGEAQVRAYASVYAAEARWDARGFTIEFRVKNSGLSPTLHTSHKANARLFVSDPSKAMTFSKAIREVPLPSGTELVRDWVIAETLEGIGATKNAPVNVWVSITTSYATVFYDKEKHNIENVEFRFEGSVDYGNSAELAPSGTHYVSARIGAISTVSAKAEVR